MKSTIFSANFTDVYGVQHPEAQCMISSVSSSNAAYFDHDGESNNQSASCSYQVLYWHSKAAKNEGARPQEFLNASLSSTFYMNSTTEVTMEAVLVKCQEHFLKEEVNQAKMEEAQG